MRPWRSRTIRTDAFVDHAGDSKHSQLVLATIIATKLVPVCLFVVFWRSDYPFRNILINVFGLVLFLLVVTSLQGFL